MVPGSASLRAAPKTLATLSRAGFGVGFDADKASTGMNVALTPLFKVGAGLTTATGIDAMAEAVLKAVAPPVAAMAKVFPDDPWV